MRSSYFLKLALVPVIISGQTVSSTTTPQPFPVNVIDQKPVHHQLDSVISDGQSTDTSRLQTLQDFVPRYQLTSASASASATVISGLVPAVSVTMSGLVLAVSESGGVVPVMNNHSVTDPSRDGTACSRARVSASAPSFTNNPFDVPAATCSSSNIPAANIFGTIASVVKPVLRGQWGII